LAYVTPVSGSYDDATGRAVLAFRKVNGMARVETPSTTIFKKLFRGKGGFRLKHPGAGRHVEFDWSRQVLVFAQGGRPVRIYHASSGKPSTPTVFGTFHFYSKTPGTNAKGMVDSNYFIRGYAVHGYAEVPPYAASHGCIRVPIPDAASIFNWIKLGETIFVYR
ncbi:MAG TPA: L,D-transpeptidase, partial [Thermoleophilaceae bacterium]|nr:L,D-transpeptidase [Thermoleophilaceae bacterium]